jgi:hypothetical protein
MNVNIGEPKTAVDTISITYLTDQESMKIPTVAVFVI